MSEWAFGLPSWMDSCFSRLLIVCSINRYWTIRRNGDRITAGRAAIYMGTGQLIILPLLPNPFPYFYYWNSQRNLLMSSARQDLYKYGLSVGYAFSVVFVSYWMCMCHDFSSVCFQGEVYLALRNWKPAQIRLNPECSCFPVKYFHRQTCIYLLTQKLICRLSSRKFPSRLKQ